MAKSKKTFRPKPRKPRGFQDRLGADLLAERAMLSRIQNVYHSFGFEPLETPAFEFTDALGKFLPDIDRPGQGVFSLQDDDQQWMSLRYDLTAPLARFVAENYDGLPKPFRRYAVGTVWRNEKPGPGRYRQFTQCDADVVGAPAPHADAEICAMFCAAIEASGVAREDFIIRVSDRQAMAGLLEVAGLAGDECREQRLITLRAMDKLDRLGEEGVRYLLGDGRKDESGDFTPGAKLTQTQSDIVIAFMAATAGSNGDTCKAMSEIIGKSETGQAGVDSLSQMAETLDTLGFSETRIRIDSSIVRGLEYYTGPVFEADLTFEVLDDKDRAIQFGSIGGGGRYDDLVARFKGIQVPAVGCSIGVSRLLAALAARAGASEVPRGPVVVLALESDQMGRYQQMAAELRAADIRAVVYVGGSGMKAQMKYADKRNAPVTVICGEDERRSGEGEQLSKQITDNNDQGFDPRRAALKANHR